MEQLYSATEIRIIPLDNGLTSGKAIEQLKRRLTLNRLNRRGQRNKCAWHRLD